jgi:hypothetical protein
MIVVNLSSGKTTASYEFVTKHDMDVVNLSSRKTTASYEFVTKDRHGRAGVKWAIGTQRIQAMTLALRSSQEGHESRWAHGSDSDLLRRGRQFVTTHNTRYKRRVQYVVNWSPGNRC